MERIPNRMERREDGQERAGDLQATQASEDARLQERLEDEQEQGGQGSTKLIAATVLQLLLHAPSLHSSHLLRHKQCTQRQSRRTTRRQGERRSYQAQQRCKMGTRLTFNGQRGRRSKSYQQAANHPRPPPTGQCNQHGWKRTGRTTPLATSFLTMSMDAVNLC